MDNDIIIKGIPASPGISISRAFIFNKGQEARADDYSVEEQDITRELDEFENAISLSIKELTKIYELSKEKIGEENSRIFDAQMEILSDKIFLNVIKQRIVRERKAASSIFEDEMRKLSNIYHSTNDEYLKERFSDLKDVKNRVIRNMKREKLVSKVPENAIVVAHELTPADIILFSRRKALGYITDTGGVTSHIAIIARALRAPAVLGTRTASSKIHSDDFIIIDGFEGKVILKPSINTIKEYEERLLIKKDYEKRLYEVIDFPGETLDGKKVELSANIEFDEEIDFVTKYGHCSIGLYRTEHLFLEAGDFPPESYQIEEYSHIADVTYPNFVTIRTYDIGGDKLLPGSQREDNPFLGWRGIRLCLDKLEVFKEQLRAILIASSKKNLKILIPMVSSLEEIEQTKHLIKSIMSGLDNEKKPYDKKIQIGIMVEVPSAFVLADKFAKQVDFFSIGTNDLIQYLLAVDRGNELVNDRFQNFHPAVLRAIKSVIEEGHKNKIKVSLCGEMASDPVAAILLIGMGIDELSVVPSVFPEIKSIIRSIKFKEVKKIAEKVLELASEKEIKTVLIDFFNNKLNHNISNLNTAELTK